jgi:predicted ATPase
MITRIEATNYRCFEQLDVDLQSFAVLVGANGAGKTTLLDIPCVLGECFQQQNIGAVFVTRQNNKPPRCSTLSELVFGAGVLFHTHGGG